MASRFLTPEAAVSLMKRATKYDDADVLDAVLHLAIGLSGIDDPEREDPGHVANREDAARAAVHFGYRQTAQCDRHCEEDLGIAV